MIRITQQRQYFQQPDNVVYDQYCEKIIVYFENPNRVAQTEVLLLHTLYNTVYLLLAFNKQKLCSVDISQLVGLQHHAMYE